MERAIERKNEQEYWPILSSVWNWQKIRYALINVAENARKLSLLICV